MKLQKLHYFIHSIKYTVCQVCPYTIDSILYCYSNTVVDCFALQFILKLLYSFVFFGFSDCLHFVSYTLNQRCPTLLLPIDCPTQFISNPNQTHLKQLMKVFRVTWKLKAGVFD